MWTGRAQPSLIKLREVRFRLRPGELLLLYSDGVTEARRGREEFGQDRLCALLADADPVPQTVADTVIDRVAAHCGGVLADDVTVVVLSAT